MREGAKRMRASWTIHIDLTHTPTLARTHTHTQQQGADRPDLGAERHSLAVIVHHIFRAETIEKLTTLAQLHNNEVLRGAHGCTDH